MLNLAQLELIRKTISANSNSVPDTLIPFIVAVCKAVPPPTVKTVEEFEAWVKLLDVPVGPQKAPTVPPSTVHVSNMIGAVTTAAPPHTPRVVGIRVVRDERVYYRGHRTDTHRWDMPIALDELDFRTDLDDQVRAEADERDLAAEDSDSCDRGEEEEDEVMDTEWSDDYEAPGNTRIAERLTGSASFVNWCREKGVPVPTVAEIVDYRFGQRLQELATPQVDAPIAPGAAVTLTEIPGITEAEPDDDVDEGEEED